MTERIMTPTACIDRLIAWNEGDDGVADDYTPDSLDFQQDLRLVLEWAFIYVPKDAPTP
jgi:hypothetical protein